MVPRVSGDRMDLIMRVESGWRQADRARRSCVGSFEETRYGTSMRLKGRAAVVTGAGQGIGAAVARLFAKEGARADSRRHKKRSCQ